MSDVNSRISKLSPEKRALLARALASRVPPGSGAEPIAIVGIGCRFPGGANDPESYWQVLAGRVDAVGEVPPDRWDAAALFDPDPSAPGKIATRWGGFLDGIDRFDPYFFGIAPREAARMDPQQRLWLEVAWEAFEDAGLTADALAGSRTGVFLGLHSHSSDYFWLQMQDVARMDAFTGTGNAHNIAAGRLAYLFDLRGPAITVDTACSSSLVAVHMACQSLRTGDCRVAIAGGVNAMLSPIWSFPLSRMQMLSPTGRCRAFDASADGFVRGEGAGAVVLKRLSDAMTDGDAIRAVIRGSAVNQDGRTNGITAPNGLSQRALLRDALQNAGVSPADISHVETHGTGTSLGDPIEIEALAEVLSEGRSPDRRCWLGAVKSNFGHLEGAAGIAGLIKVVLSLEKRSIPPVALYQSLNPHISVDTQAFPIPTDVVAWPDDGRPRLAGISSFGWSGTNAHLIVEEGPSLAVADDAPKAGPYLLPLSAHNADALTATAARYRDFLRSEAAANLAGVCASAALRRTHHDHRLAVVGTNASEIAEALDAFGRGERRANVVGGVRSSGGAPGVVFVFCGQGPQQPGMAHELLDTEPVFRAAIERVDAVVAAVAGWSVIDQLLAPAGPSRLEDTEIAQPVNFALQFALAELWRSWGIEPAAVVGHSAGEVAAACAAGILSIDDAARLAIVRGRLMQSGAGGGRMVSVEMAVDAIRKIVADWTGLSIAAINGPRSTVLSGTPEAIDRAVAALNAHAGSRMLPGTYAFHSDQMQAAAAELPRLLEPLVTAPARVPMISTVTGQPCDGRDLGAAYWGRNVRETVRFAEAIGPLVSRAGRVFLEIGPHPVLSHPIAETADAVGQQPVILHSLHRDKATRTAMLTAAGALYAAGCRLDWTRLVRAGSPPVRLPLYAWQRERYWLDGLSLPGIGTASKPPDAADGLLYHLTWRQIPDARATAEAAEPGVWLVVADRGGVAARLAAELKRCGHDTVVIGNAARGDESLQRACGDLASSDGARWRGIVHLRTLDAPSAASSSIDAAALLASQEQSCFTLAGIVRALVGAGAAAGLSVRVVTRGAQAVQPGEMPAVAQSPVWGVGRVLGLEHPDLACAFIDLDPSDIDDIPALAREITRAHVEPQVAIRGAVRFAPRVCRLESVSTPRQPLALDPAGAYVITGGTGALGLHLAEWLVRRGARRIVLASRSGGNATTLTAVEKLRTAGTQVDIAKCDVSCLSDVTALFDSIAAAGVPIKGVAHAAGTVQDGVLLHQDWAALEHALLPKLAGAWNLHQASRTLALDFFLLYSSVSSLLGSAGQSAYAAGNAFLDALAQMRRTAGLPGTSINWGVWAGAGMADTLDETSRRRLAEAGFAPMEPALALAGLERAIAVSRPQVAVASIDWTRHFAYRGRRPEFLCELAEGTSGAQTGGEAPLLQVLQQAAVERRRSVLLNHVKQQTLSVLGVPPTHAIDTDRGLRDAGIDSLMALELKNRLQTAVGQPLPSTLAFDFPTIAAITAFLADEILHLDTPPPSTAGAAAPPRTPAADVSDLSDDEAERLLADELASLRRQRTTAAEAKTLGSRRG